MIAVLLAFAIGAGIDFYIRSEAKRNTHCFGGNGWEYQVALIADHPLIAIGSFNEFGGYYVAAMLLHAQH
jgi:hypothetical protein